MQGILYVYRENRRIPGPDWLDMYRKEPLTLCRVELSFDHKLDDAFQVDIKKSRILLDDSLYEWLRDRFLPGPRREAEAPTPQGSRRIGNRNRRPCLHSASNVAIHSKVDNLKTADVKEVDGKSGDVTITNKLWYNQAEDQAYCLNLPGNYTFNRRTGIQDGMLWEPAFIEGNQAVRINTGHPYYHKVYVPNQNSGVTIQGLDSLMWALCAAELGNVSEENKRNFEEMRYEVSRISPEAGRGPACQTLLTQRLRAVDVHVGCPFLILIESRNISPRDLGVALAGVLVRNNGAMCASIRAVDIEEPNGSCRPR